MSNIEKEYRYRISDEQIKIIKENCTTIEENCVQLDLTLGYSGFESLYKYGYVCRVRQKSNKIWMEVKTRQKDESFKETEVNIKTFNEGVAFFKAIGMKPYMYMRRNREILKYKGLKIFIDDIEMLGKFVEIEFQDSKDAEHEIEEFINVIGIEPIMQPLYGDILNDLLGKDENFKKEYENKLKKFIEEV